MQEYFNPHLPCGRWQETQKITQKQVQFQSTPSLRKVTTTQTLQNSSSAYFNPHLPCGRWQLITEIIFHSLKISIHTFLAEGDRQEDIIGAYHVPFQSTPSLRKVTVRKLYKRSTPALFKSTPSLRKVTLQLPLDNVVFLISIHTFLA